MREKIAGWIFGITSSLFGVIIFYHTRLYAQSAISLYYAAIGIYGWIYWMKAKERNEHIHRWKISTHLILIILFGMLSVVCYYLFKKYTDASNPLADSFITVFGFLASIKEARKILSSWIYWFAINLASAWLYYGQGLLVYTILMIVYAGICIPGYLSWLKIYRLNKIS
jgi:nicotinamide mononucleotide transporter